MMLVSIFSILSIASAVAACWGKEVLVWLWLLPVTAVGTFLLLAVLWFLLLVIMSAAVNIKKEQTKDSPLYRTVLHLTERALIPLLRVHIHAEGLEKIPQDRRFLLVCNHLDETDPVVLLHCLRKSQLAFISKRENDTRFIIGPFLRKILCQPINRENDREALKTILRCIQLIKDDLVSIAVFPEGYVSMDRLLHPFRPGVFKIAQRAKVPIVVCTLRDTHHIYANALNLKRSDVTLHLVDVIEPEALEGVTTVQIADRVHKMMADDLGPELVLTVDS